MAISERIESISSYFKEMQVTTVDGNTLIYVVVRFPERWIVDESVSEKYKVLVQRGAEPGEYYFCGDIADGEDSVFDAVEYSVTKMKEALERSRLLTEKVNELTSIFSDESIPLDSLRNLRILCNRESPHSLSGIISQAAAPSPSAGEETSVDGNVTEQTPEGTAQTASRRKKN